MKNKILPPRFSLFGYSVSQEIGGNASHVTSATTSELGWHCPSPVYWYNGSRWLVSSFLLELTVSLLTSITTTRAEIKVGVAYFVPQDWSGSWQLSCGRKIRKIHDVVVAQHSSLVPECQDEIYKSWYMHRYILKVNLQPISPSPKHKPTLCDQGFLQ